MYIWQGRKHVPDYIRRESDVSKRGGRLYCRDDGITVKAVCVLGMPSDDARGRKSW